MRNGTTDILRSERDVSPDLEALIRQKLPEEVKRFALEKASVDYSWISLYKHWRDHGAAATIQLMKHNNAVVQVEAYGDGYHRTLSPWRDY